METKLNPPVWSCVERSFSAPRWNFAACSVMAIPAWKVFVYGGLEGTLDGGNNRQGVLCGDVTVLDAGLNRWVCPSIDGLVQPKARADAVLIYDSKSSRLILFGGWANEWLGDVFTLDVAHVVGPPYAVMDLYPQIGPLTGSTTLQVTGIDFINTKDVVVRFSSKFGTIDVHGEFLSSTKLVCTAPDFSAYPAGAVDVRVALNGDSFTTTSQVYTYFAVTSAQDSLIFGPGLLNGGACTEETMFIIQARDNLNCNRTTGGDEFIASINLLSGGENGEDVQLRNCVEMRDNDDGTYYVSFTAPSPGTYMVAVEFLGTFGGSPGQVRGSQINVHFEEFVPRSNNAMTGKLVSLAVKQDIQTLAAFSKSVAAGIQAKPSDDGWTDLQNRAALVSVKKHLNMIQEMKQEIDLLIDRLECILLHHKSQGINIGPQAKLVELYRTSWVASQREAPSIFLKIAPLVKAEGARSKGDLLYYEARMREFQKSVESAPFVLYETGTHKAMELLSFMINAYEEEEVRCQNMIHLAKMFECPADVAISRDLLSSAGGMLKSYQEVWACAGECETYIEEAGNLIWDDLDADGLEENARLILTKVKQHPASVKQSDAYFGLERTAKEFLMTCPVLSSLRQQTMRDRHWDEIGKITGGSGVLGQHSAFHGMRLADILSLKLHLHIAAVVDVTDKASREAAHEETLRALSMTWDSVKFRVAYYKDTDVPLLKMTEDDVDQLEADQLTLQSMVASRYNHFKAKAMEWQCALVAVSDVVQMLSDIQRTWSYLEPLFIGSDEVRRELPEDAMRFAMIDEQVRKTLKSMADVRNVKQACQYRGLIERLDSINSDQDLCKKALADFLAGKRCKFPRSAPSVLLITGDVIIHLI